MSAKLRAERPLSPHLSVYKPQITSMLSILHRITGFGLSVGTLLLGAWLWSAAFSPSFYATLTEVTASWFGRVFLFGWTVAFFYHLFNGIRHLMWDAGMGLTIPSVNRSGIAVLLLTLALSVGVWAYVLLY